MRRLRSRLTVIPTTKVIADRAVKLLEDAGLDVHETSRPRFVVATAPTALPQGGSCYG